MMGEYTKLTDDISLTYWSQEDISHPSKFERKTNYLECHPNKHLALALQHRVEGCINPSRVSSSNSIKNDKDLVLAAYDFAVRRCIWRESWQSVLKRVNISMHYGIKKNMSRDDNSHGYDDDLFSRSTPKMSFKDDEIDTLLRDISIALDADQGNESIYEICENDIKQQDDVYNVMYNDLQEKNLQTVNHETFGDIIRLTFTDALLSSEVDRGAGTCLKHSTSTFSMAGTSCVMIVCTNGIILYDYISLKASVISSNDLNGKQVTYAEIVGRNMLGIGCSDGLIRIWDCLNWKLIPAKGFDAHSKGGEVVYLRNIIGSKKSQADDKEYMRFLSVGML